MEMLAVCSPSRGICEPVPFGTLGIQSLGKVTNKHRKANIVVPCIIMLWSNTLVVTFSLSLRSLLVSLLYNQGSSNYHRLRSQEDHVAVSCKNNCLMNLETELRIVENSYHILRFVFGV